MTQTRCDKGRWLLPDFERERAAVEVEINAWKKELDPTAVLKRLRKEVDGHADALETTLQMRAFVCALAALQTGRERNDLKDKTAKALVRKAERILRNAGIRPGVSRLSPLYEELYLLRAGIRLKQGDRLSAMFLRDQARKAKHGSNERDLSWHIDRAEDVLRLGQTVVALNTLDDTERLLDSNPKMEARVLLGRIAANRLSTDWATAAATLAIAQTASCNWDDADTARLRWEEVRLSGVTEGPERLILAARRMPLSPEQALEVYLWSSAWQKRAYEDRIDQPRSIKRRHGLGTRWEHHDLLVFASTIESCYDRKTPLSTSLESLGNAMSRLRHLVAIDHELLVYAATLRWLVRARQLTFADLIFGEYRGLCQKLSNGRSSDVLNLVDDLTPKVELRSLELTSTDLDLPPNDVSRPLTGRIETSLANARVVLAILSLSLRGFLKRQIVDRERKKAIELRDKRDVARILSRYARRRRGVVLKVGQILSYLDSSIDPLIKQEFDVLEAEIATTPAQNVERVIEEDLGRRLSEIFVRFDPTPFASGSIGQVHYALGHDGTEYAVKVQYPEIKRLIELDFRQSWLFKPLCKAVLPSIDFDALVADTLRQVLTETDYRVEMNSHLTFSSLFADDPAVVIPRVFPDLCGARVLTTEYLRGKNFNEFLHEASQEQKNLAGATMMRMHLESMITHGIFNLDPQPANYLFQDDKVVFIDFGCVRRFSRTFHQLRNESIRAFFDGDKARLAAAQLELGLFPRGFVLDADALWRMHEVVFRPCGPDQPFTFTPDFVKEGSAAQTEHHPHRTALTLTAEQLAASRFDFGFFELLGSLRATADWRSMLFPLIYD